jgi:hypothetical protein
LGVVAEAGRAVEARQYVEAGAVEEEAGAEAETGAIEEEAGAAGEVKEEAGAESEAGAVEAEAGAPYIDFTTCLANCIANPKYAIKNNIR